MSDRIDRDVINALIAGHFADPFSVLGMHQTDAGLEVRALLRSEERRVRERV